MYTLAGPYLVGTDIFLEFYYAQLHNGENVLPQVMYVPQGTSIVNSLIAPTIPVSLLVTYKLVFPLVFCLTAPMLYYLLKRWLPPEQALLSVLAFIAFPPFFIEVPGIARQMLAEVVLLGLATLSIASPLKTKILLPLSTFLGGILPLLHYSIAIIAPVLVLPGAVVLWKGQRTRAVALLVGVATCTLVSVPYFYYAERGAVAEKLQHVYNALAPATLQVNTGLSLPELPGPALEKGPDITPIQAETSLLSRYEELVQISLGTDFLLTTNFGKVFRLLQWTFLLLLLVGIWKLRRSKTFWTLGSGGLLLLAVSLVPGVGGLLNITRSTHIALLALAPAVAVAIRPKYFLVFLLLYFSFTSGLVFEATKQPNVEQVTIPYNVALSDHRLDLGATFTSDDERVRQYILDNKLFPVWADTAGANYIGAVVGWRPDLHASLHRDGYKPTQGYVFVRSRNVKDGVFTVWNGVGRRKVMSPEVYGIDWSENVVYQSGESRLIKVRGEEP
jgi:uncharacterized membrane protein